MSSVNVELESLTIPELIAFIRSSLRKEEFEAVAAISVSREMRLSSELSLKEAEKAELENRIETEKSGFGSAIAELDGLEEENGIKKRQVSSKEALEIELEAKCNALEKELVVYKGKCLELEEKIREGESGFMVVVSELREKLKELEDVSASMEVLQHEKLALVEEHDKHKRMCGKHEELIARLKEDHGVVCERERKVHERFAELTEKLETKEKEAKERLFEIHAGNKNEVEEWKRKYGKVEARALRLIEENVALKEKMKMIENQQGNKQSCASAGNHNTVCVKEKKSTTHARECKSQKRIAELMRELERKEEDVRELERKEEEVRERLLELEARSRDEADEWKWKYGEVEERQLRLLENNMALNEMLEIKENEWENKQSCSSTGDRNSMYMKKDNAPGHARELMSQERVAELMHELERKEEAKEMLLGLVARNKDEADKWKRKYGEVEAWALQLLKDNMILNNKLEMINNEQGNKQSSAGTGDQNGEHGKHPIAIKPSLEQGVSLEGRESPTIVQGLRPLLGVVVEISDHEDEMIVEADGFQDNAIEELAGVKNDVTPQVFSDQRDLNAVKDDSRSSEQSFHVTAASTRKRVLRTVTGRSTECDDDNDDDRIPISQLKKKRLAEAIKRSNQLDDSSVKYSFGCANILNVVDIPKKHLLPQPRQEVGATQSSSGALDSLIWPPADTNNMILFNSGTVCHKLESPDAREAGENEMFGRKGVDDVRSGIESNRLDGCSVNWSAGSESRCNSNEASRSVTDGSENDKVLPENLQERDSRRWKYKTDMLLSLGKNPVLCMQAVCAIYRQQMSQEKSFKETKYTRNHGFKPFDAYKGTKMAEFLMNGDPHGPLEKTTEDLQNHDPRGLDYCLTLATDYLDQLFMIYQSNLDPFFSS